MSEFTKEYFIDKFSKIPEDEYCICNFKYKNAHCVLGHCGIKVDNFYLTEEAKALINLFDKDFDFSETGNIADSTIVKINDGIDADITISVKQRILNALNSLS